MSDAAANLAALPQEFGQDERLLGILGLAPIGATILDETDSVVFMNGPLAEMIGAGDREALDEARRHNFFRDERLFREMVGQVLESGLAANADIELARPDQAEAWASVTMQRIDYQGAPATLSWFQDRTQHMLALKDLERSEDALMSVLEAAPIGATVLDADGRVLFWNSRLIDILGVQGEEFADTASLVFNGDTTVRDTLLEDMRRHGRIRDAWIAPVRPDGSTLAALVSMEPVIFERQDGVLTWLYDVSELRRAQEISEAATAAKSAFLATMSHEIRTPMNGVVAMSELLSETNLTRDQSAMVKTIQEAGQSLIVIINDILDFSKIEAGRLEIESVPFAPRALVESVSALLGPKAHEKGLGFILKIDDQVPDWVMGDPTRLRQLLLNITGNAIKFTEKGEVALIVRTHEGGIGVEVRDTGIGISPEEEAQLFRSFSQADVSTARRFGGTGLGLSICKGLVDLMGGEIGVISEPEVGSTFWFNLPLAECAAPPEAAQTGRAARQQRWSAPSLETARQAGTVILCAEDNPINREVLRRVLDRLGLVYELVENGDLALRALVQRRYGLLLTDCHMPVMDGWALSRTIRAAEEETGATRMPIIALTADAVKGTEESCRAAGMDAYVTKPVAIEALETALAQWLPQALELRTLLEDGEPPSGFMIDPDDVIDTRALAELVGGDQGEINGMLRDFLTMAEPLVTLVLEQIETNREEAHRAAHSLKSAARYVGAHALAEVAAEVEMALAENDIHWAKLAASPLLPNFETVSLAIETLTLGRSLVEVSSEISQLAETPSDDGTDSGLELQAVVGITEQAASRILEAAEAIADRIERIEDEEEVKLIEAQLTAIFEACSFQDLTSQRVRKAIARLAAIEEKLSNAVRRFSRDEPPRPEPEPLKLRNDFQNQDEIDRLWAGLGS